MTTSRIIYIIEDDPIMAECIARAATASKTDQQSLYSENPQNISVNAQAKTDQQSFSTHSFPDAISALQALDRELPDLILLDVLLTGPNGFTLLNELASYTDTAAIPIIIISSLDLKLRDLRPYGVVAVLNKSTMTPATIQKAIEDVI